MSMPPRYAVTIHTPEHLRNFSHVLAGLFELEHAGFVTLRVQLDLGLPEPGQHTVRLVVRELASGRALTLLVDTKDGADIHPRHLDLADVILKRSFEPAHIAATVPPEQRHKVIPLGLFMNARSRHEHDLWRFYAGLAGYAARAVDRVPGRSPAGLRGLRALASHVNQNLVARVREFPTLPFIDQIEQLGAATSNGADADTDPIVVFQTRVFAPYADDPPEFLASKVHENARRVDLVRALREALGSRFVGGIVPDAYARKHYREVLTDQPTDQASYLALMRRARVVVYSAGLVGSAARKLAEYLAAGKAVVMQRLPATLPEPLVDGRDVVVWDDVDACVAACRSLVDDAPRARLLGGSARAYYHAWVTPASYVRRALEACFAIT